MSKLDQIIHVDNNTGEIIPIDKVESIIKEEWKDNLLRIKKLLEIDPTVLTLEDIDVYIKLENKNRNRGNKIKTDGINKFNSYYQTNNELEVKLIETGISPNTYYYFKILIAKYCSLCYTLKFRNHKNITKDSQIADRLNMSDRNWRKIKSELINLNLIRIINFENNKYYKINPCFVGKAKKLTPHTYDAFRDELIKYNLLEPIQILYWDKLMYEEYLRTYSV